MQDVTAFTDGACLGNPGPGGWAALVRFGEHEKLISGGELDTTNNRMELLAAIEALALLTRPCRVHLTTDSQYVKQGVQSWMAPWKANGWKTSARKPVKNQDLWQRLDEENQRHDVTWAWVKGHSGHPENERVDDAARAEAEQLRGQ